MFHGIEKSSPKASWSWITTHKKLLKNRFRGHSIVSVQHTVRDIKPLLIHLCCFHPNRHENRWTVEGTTNQPSLLQVVVTGCCFFFTAFSLCHLQPVQLSVSTARPAHPYVSPEEGLPSVPAQSRGCEGDTRRHQEGCELHRGPGWDKGGLLWFVNHAKLL